MSEKYAWEGKGLDEVSAKELYLYITNDGDLYRQQWSPIQKNLVAKKARGVYDHDRAAILFGYLVESGAQKYCKKFCGKGDKWYEIFPKKLRNAVAEEMRDYFETEYNLGSYRELVPKKYQTAHKPKSRKSRTRKSVNTTLGGLR